MAIPDKNRIYDGWISLEGGVDAGRDANIIGLNQCVSSENMTFRTGKPSTRPGFKLMRIDKTPRPNFPTGDFSNGNSSFDANGNYAGDGVTILGQEASTIFKNGIFQCALAYSPHNGQDCIMALIGGRLFRIIPGTVSARVDEIIVEVSSVEQSRGFKPYRNRANITLGYMVQADKWFIAQDGESKAILYDGTKARRSNLEGTRDTTEVPTGTIMAYGMGRVVVVVNDRDIAFGDLYGSHLDTQTDPSDSLILFTERNFLSEGFDAAIPFEQGVVTGLSFFPQLDTSTGNGQLLAFAERGAAAFFLNIDRTLWKTSQFQIKALDTTGLRGHRSLSTANEDLWFRADDGVRSYRQARSEQYGWAHIPQSTNVKQFLRNDTNAILKYASGIFFDNRVILTTSPYPNILRPFHTGLVVVDFDILSSFGTNNRPAWDGHWTFPNRIGVTQLLVGTFNGVTRAFAFGLDSAYQNQLYEVTLDTKDDVMSYRIDPGHPDLGPIIPIPQLISWENVSRAFDFAKSTQSSTEFTENELYDADLWIKNIGDVDMPLTVDYRVDDYPFWLPWREFSQRFGLINIPSALDLGGVPLAQPGFAPRTSFGKPPDRCDATTGRNLRRGYEMQVRLRGTGRATLNRFRIHAQRQIEKATAQC